MRITAAFALSAALLLGACTDQYGRPDPAGTALLGAAAGAVAGLAIAGSMNSGKRDPYHYPRGYGRPRGGYHGGHHGPPPGHGYRRW